MEEEILKIKEVYYELLGDLAFEAIVDPGLKEAGTKLWITLNSF